MDKLTTNEKLFEKIEKRKLKSMSDLFKINDQDPLKIAEQLYRLILSTDGYVFTLGSDFFTVSSADLTGIVWHKKIKLSSDRRRKIFNHLRQIQWSK